MCDGQTDGQTDGLTSTIAQPTLRIASHSRMLESKLTNFVHLFKFLLQICLEKSGSFSVWKVAVMNIMYFVYHDRNVSHTSSQGRVTGGWASLLSLLLSTGQTAVKPSGAKAADRAQCAAPNTPIGY